MGIVILILLGVGVVYTAVGFVVTYVDNQAVDDDFTLDWDKIFKWPKHVFGSGR